MAHSAFTFKTQLKQFESTFMKILEPQQSVFQSLLYNTSKLLAGILLEE